MASERGTEIMELLRSRHRISVAELSERFGISAVTARKDLTRLESSGLAVRTRGGAVLARAVAAERPIDARRNDKLESKAAIAGSAAAHVHDGDTVFLDSGTTIAALALLIRGRPVRVVTHSLLVVEALSDDEAVSLYVLGGMYNKEARSFVGPSAIADLGRYSIDIAFVGASGLEIDGACSAQNVLEAEVKRAALSACARRIVVCDSSKLGVRSFALFARAGDYDCIVTDAELDNVSVGRLRATGTEVVVAGK